MPRPQKHRNIRCKPAAYYFKPRGIPILNLEEVILERDELESLRLADLFAFSHEEAAEKMKISRATFGRIVEKARMKVTDCILNGKAIKILEKYPANIKKFSARVCKNCDFKIRVVKNTKNTVCSNCKHKI